MPIGRCRLCGFESDLQLSHILPAFLYRWMRTTSGNSHLRYGGAPNKRVQDGLKYYWLCASCETLLSGSETAFANNLFYPYEKDESLRIAYDEWLLHFCVSVSWRVLRYYIEETPLETEESDSFGRIAEAESTWKAFLRGQRPHPGPFQQHLLPFSQIDSISSSLEDLSPSLNRYLMRTIDMDFCRSDTMLCVFSKFGPFAILGFIREDRPSQWNGGKVHVRNGWIEPRKYKMPAAFFHYLNSKARKSAEILAGISPRQADKIDKAFHANKDHYVGSGEFLAMLNDIRLFGDAAFSQDRSQTDEEKET